MRDEILKPSEDEASLKRLVFSYVPLDLPASIPMKFEPGESVLLLSPGGMTALQQVQETSSAWIMGLTYSPCPIMQGNFGPGETGYDIRTAEGARGASDRIAGLTSLVGMFIVLPQDVSESLKSMEDVSRLLRGLFILLKTFLQSPAGKFVVLIHSGENTETPGWLPVEGMLGLFLSAAQEYPAVQFRTLEISRDTDLRTALARCPGQRIHYSRTGPS